MACTAPITIESPVGNVQVRCRQCVGCRITRQSGWTLRNLLEAQQHSTSAFVTLTYNEENVPEKLDYRDFSLFLKRLRRQVSTIRYFAVGEYGSKTGRPHWHALIYGIPGQERGPWRTAPWHQGFAYIGQVTPESIRYTARYCLKFGEKGEEAMMRCSLKPGIGWRSMKAIGSEMGQRNYELTEIPTVLAVEGRNWPLDETMRRAFQEGYNENGGNQVPERSALIAHGEYVLRMVGGDPISQSVYRRQTFLEAIRAGKFRFAREEI